MRVFIGLTTDPEAAAKINRLRQRYYPSSLDLHPPHISLVEPFDVASTTRLKGRLAKLKLPSLRLKITGWGVFPARRSILYLRVADHPGLRALQTEVAQAAGQQLHHPFHPHFTIGRLDPTRLSEAKVELGQTQTWSFRGVALVVFEKTDGGWKELKSYHLPTR